jgi:L-asparaginase II
VSNSFSANPYFETNPVLVEVVRSGYVESIHRGSVVLYDQSGNIRTFGHPDRQTYPRSSHKPLQAVAMVRNGLDLPPHLLALVGASHEGTKEHVETAKAILATAGLDETALDNTMSMPESPKAAYEWASAGGRADRIHHNCSGKHSGMVATCVINNWPTQGYRDPEHPLQKAILATVEDLAEEKIGATAVDGCGAPIHAISTKGLALAFRKIRLAAPGTPEAQVADAMSAYPFLVGGEGRDVTDLMTGAPGVFAKDGAEAVYGAAHLDGRAMASKLDDGALRSSGTVFAAVLKSWGYDTPEVNEWFSYPVLGGGNRVGEIRPSKEFLDWLGV